MVLLGKINHFVCYVSCIVCVILALCFCDEVLVIYTMHWLSRDSVLVNFVHTSVAEAISVGHITVATSIIELHSLVMFDGYM